MPTSTRPAERLLTDALNMLALNVPSPKPPAVRAAMLKLEKARHLLERARNINPSGGRKTRPAATPRTAVR